MAERKLFHECQQLCVLYILTFIYKAIGITILKEKLGYVNITC